VTLRSTFFAHSLSGQPTVTWEPLETHLQNVAALAREFASVFDSGDWGYLAGLWHDLGKYRAEFQRRLHGSGEQAEHAGAGAALALERSALPLAFVVAGHHSGLANHQSQGETKQRPLVERVRDNLAVLDQIRSDVPPAIASKPIAFPPEFLRVSSAGDERTRAQEFWIRLLFSALIDADRLATEAFYSPTRRNPIRTFESISVLRARLDESLARFSQDSPVNRIRAEVLAQCRLAADQQPGLFSLTVPTGGGKTLSSLAFALRHAEKHGLRRVIVVIPYTSIIEQTARVYKDAVGDDNVIEHHSAFDERAANEESGDREIRRRLAVENWDAPIVVTTGVQFFESLFSNHASRCRKLHNVVRSVVIVDEAQTLPTPYLLCVLDAMRELTSRYGCSLVLSTATQPALGKRTTLPSGLEGVREIVPEPDRLGERLDRVEIVWPRPDDPPVEYDQLATELAQHDRVLAIVHRRHDARELAEQLPGDGRFHLSALMCAAHRSVVLSSIRERLAKHGTVCRVVATQLVEAGVDLDFPVVYRAMAGLDSLAQAAGRCNREGRLTSDDGAAARGSFRVFRAVTPPPIGTRAGLAKAEEMLRRHGDALNFRDGRYFDEYFRSVYFAQNLDAHQLMVERARLNFATVGERFRLIEDGFSEPLIAPWGDAEDRVARFVRNPSRETQRALQPYVVQVRDRDVARLQQMGALSPLDGFGYTLATPYRRLYEETFGLVLAEDSLADPSALLV
jgi:CRISPR-associated endonuclease/helicase Cas3